MIAAVRIHSIDQNSVFLDSIRTTFNDFIGRAGLLWFAFYTVVVVAVIVVAVMDLAVTVLHVAVMDLFWGRYRLWPSLLWPLYGLWPL